MSRAPRGARAAAWPALTAVAGALLARAFYALVRPAWFDETFTLWISRQPPARLLESLRLDSGPPLFYLLEKPFAVLEGALGPAPTARLLPYLAAAALFALAAVRRFSAGRAFPWLLAACPLLAFYSAEARAYALLAALSLALFLATARARPGRASSAAAAAATAALLYTHYLGVLVVAGSMALCLLRGRRRRLWPQAAGAALFLPWLPVLLRQPRAAVAWNSTPLAESLGQSLAHLGFWGPPPPYFGSWQPPAPWVGMALGAILLGGTVAAARRRTAIQDALFFALLPLAAAAAAGPWHRVYFPARTEMAALPVLLWAFARAARRSRAVRAGAAAACALGLFAIARAAARPPAPPPYEVTAALVRRQARPGDLVVAAQAEYLPLRLSRDRGRLAADLVGVPSDVERHPGWFGFGPPEHPAAERRRIDLAAARVPPGARIFFAIPPDAALREFLSPFLRLGRPRVEQPPGGNAVLVVRKAA
jgi:hypothetical protein